MMKMCIVQFIVLHELLVCWIVSKTLWYGSSMRISERVHFLRVYVDDKLKCGGKVPCDGATATAAEAAIKTRPEWGPDGKALEAITYTYTYRCECTDLCIQTFVNLVQLPYIIEMSKTTTTKTQLEWELFVCHLLDLMLFSGYLKERSHIPPY